MTSPTGRTEGGTRSPWVLSALALTVSLLLLTTLVATSWAPLHQLDLRVATWGYSQTSGRPGATAWWIGVATYGAPVVQRGLVLVLAGVMALRDQRPTALWLVAVVVVENIVAPFTKLLLSRPRPQWSSPIAVEPSTSYPSGHVAAAATFALAVIVLLPRLTTTRLSRRLAAGATLLLAGLICADRILLGVHYLTDVAGGILLGTLLTVLLVPLLPGSGSGPARPASAPG